MEVSMKKNLPKIQENSNHGNDQLLLYDIRYIYSVIVDHKKIIKTEINHNSKKSYKINISTDPAFVLPMLLLPIILSLCKTCLMICWIFFTDFPIS
jgi:hypothetical protein